MIEAAAGTQIQTVLATAQTVLEYVGTMAFAVSGALVAARKRMDVGGVIVLGAIVSVGGGTTRDLLLGRPVFWVHDPTVLAVGALTALVVLLIGRFVNAGARPAYWLVQVFDALGLALFVVTSTSIALVYGAAPVSAVVIGVVAGIGGGVIRDLLADELPVVLTDPRLYITAALAGSILYLALLRAEAPDVITLWAPIGLILLLRLISLRYGIGIPKVTADLGADPRRRD